MNDNNDNDDKRQKEAENDDKKKKVNTDNEEYSSNYDDDNINASNTSTNNNNNDSRRAGNTDSNDRDHEGEVVDDEDDESYASQSLLEGSLSPSLIDDINNNKSQPIEPEERPLCAPRHQNIEQSSQQEQQDTNNNNISNVNGDDIVAGEHQRYTQKRHKKGGHGTSINNPTIKQNKSPFQQEQQDTDQSQGSNAYYVRRMAPRHYLKKSDKAGNNGNASSDENNIFVEHRRLHPRRGKNSDKKDETNKTILLPKTLSSSGVSTSTSNNTSSEPQQQEETAIYNARDYSNNNDNPPQPKNIFSDSISVSSDDMDETIDTRNSFDDDFMEHVRRRYAPKSQQTDIMDKQSSKVTKKQTKKSESDGKQIERCSPHPLRQKYRSPPSAGLPQYSSDEAQSIITSSDDTKSMLDEELMDAVRSRYASTQNGDDNDSDKDDETIDNNSALFHSMQNVMDPTLGSTTSNHRPQKDERLRTGQQSYQELPITQSDPETTPANDIQNGTNEETPDSDLNTPGAFAVTSLRRDVSDGLGDDSILTTTDNQLENMEAQQQQQPRPPSPISSSSSDSLVVAAAVVQDEQELIQETENRVRNELIINATQAKAVDFQKRNRRIICCVLLFFIILGVSIGATISLSNRNNNGNDNNIIIASQSPSISMAPTQLPSFSPSSLPSALPSSMPSPTPTLTPSNTPSSHPSDAPTSSPTSPENQDCANAIFLDDVPNNKLTGDLYFGSPATTVTACATEQTSGIFVDITDIDTTRYYGFVGTGASITVRMCTRSDSLVYGIVGDSCGDTFCEDYDGLTTIEITTNNADGDCPRELLYILETRFGTTYRFKVLAFLPNPDPVISAVFGSFSVHQSDAAYSIELTQSNFNCNGATTLEFTRLRSLSPSLDVFGSTKGAPVDNFVQSCNLVANEKLPGVWYIFQGEGDFVELSACDVKFGTTQQLSVFTPNIWDDDYFFNFGFMDCKSGLFCEGSSVDSCADPVKFEAKDGIWYYIFVATLGKEGSDFVLMAPPLQPTQFVCRGAIKLDPITNFYPGAEISMLHDVIPPYYDPYQCIDDVADIQNPLSVWYKFEGRDSILEIENICEGDRQNFGFSVMSSSSSLSSMHDGCDLDNFECIGNVRECSLVGNQTLSFPTIVGKTYYIQATGDNVSGEINFGFRIVNETLFL